ALTAEKFITNTFDQTAEGITHSERLYRTGDRAALRADNFIDYLGRIDQQVKIRGFRIEPGEIENRLMEMDGIEDVVVLPGENIHKKTGEIEDKYLCAYVVSGDKETFAPNRLREHLGRLLPEYMIPAYFVHMEAFPLTPTGKLDRRALPLPGTTDALGEYIAPRDEREKQLARIWSEILNVPVEKIGIHSNFFHIGGHSLKSTILVARIHKAFNVKISLNDIFTASTIKLLAELIDASSETRYASILPVEKKEYYPVSSAQERLYVVRQMTGADTAYNMPQVMELSDQLDVDRLENSFKQLIRRHESLRTSFKMVGEIPMQEINDTAEFAIDRHGFSGTPCPPAEVEGIVAAFIKPFLLDRAPLLRVGLVKTAETYILLVDMHHIISDGTSMVIMIKEFEALYSGSMPAPLKIQYKDYSEWQNSDKMTAVIGRQETFWMRELAGEIPVLKLPYDFARPAVQSFEGGSVKFSLPPAETEKLRTLAQKQDATLYMVLLAMFNVFLARMSGQEDIIVGCPIAGRRHADLESVIGMFVNTLVMRNYPTKNKGFNQFLDEIKEHTLQAFENQEFQFEDMVEKIKLQRDAGRNPLFDVVLVLQNLEETDKNTEKTHIRPYDTHHHISKFDMTLTVVETGDFLSFSLEYCSRLFK
ncbi:MAG: non-ribosomal peptide synthetase, partial [bacterium]|nr:non-ribosomal peptide synthetase [bacterium]